VASFDQTIRAEKINLDKTYTNEFARRAKEKFKA
jgi:NitT/TauT family transport system substrate-binding protein